MTTLTTSVRPARTASLRSSPVFWGAVAALHDIYFSFEFHFSRIHREGIAFNFLSYMWLFGCIVLGLQAWQREQSGATTPSYKARVMRGGLISLSLGFILLLYKFMMLSLFFQIDLDYLRRDFGSFVATLPPVGDSIAAALDSLFSAVVTPLGTGLTSFVGAVVIGTLLSMLAALVVRPAEGRLTQL